jgi:hypothetical protein
VKHERKTVEPSTVDDDDRGVKREPRRAREMAAVNDARRTRTADLILAGLAEISQRLARIEHSLAGIADDVDALDRYQRPYGDGAKLPQRRRRE